jgi:ethanolamine utilization protein EutQ
MQTEFPLTLTYDEVDYIIEGQLTIKVNGKEITAKAGDMLLIPSGSKIVWSALNYAKFIYVTYPANWSELL